MTPPSLYIPPPSAPTTDDAQMMWGVSLPHPPRIQPPEMYRGGVQALLGALFYPPIRDPPTVHYAWRIRGPKVMYCWPFWAAGARKCCTVCAFFCPLCVTTPLYISPLRDPPSLYIPS